jgi:hypothetical protein
VKLFKFYTSFNFLSWFVFCGSQVSSWGCLVLDVQFSCKRHKLLMQRWSFQVVRDKRTGKTKGFGFVSFANPSDLALAFKEMNGKCCTCKDHLTFSGSFALLFAGL